MVVMEDIEAEKWFPMKNWEPQYQITESGRVRQRATKREIRPYKDRAGYLIYCLCDYYDRDARHEYVKKARLAHRLVAQTFLFNPNNYPEVNHKDCDKSNNHVSNLEWVSKYQNTKHAKEKGRYNIRYVKTPIGYAYRQIGKKVQLVKLLPES